MSFSRLALALSTPALALIDCGIGPDASTSRKLVVKEGVAQFGSGDGRKPPYLLGSSGTNSGEQLAWEGLPEELQAAQKSLLPWEVSQASEVPKNGQWWCNSHCAVI